MNLGQLLGLIEVIGVFAIVIGFCVFELRRTNKALRKNDQDEDPT